VLVAMVLVVKGHVFKQCAILTLKKWAILGAPLFNSRVDCRSLIATTLVVKARVLNKL